LQHPPADEPHRTAPAVERVEGQQDRGHGEDREAGVVDPDPAEHVAEAAHRHHQDSLHQPVPHDHPQQVGDVARGQRIQVHAAEDGWQRDEDDRAVQGGHEDRGRRVGERRPLVPVVGGRPGRFGGHQMC
jgi:hypothetical protein